MENILKKSSGRTERFVLAFAIVVVMVFGVLNPLTYVTDFNTAQEICGMGFPTDIRCKGIRSDVFERSDSSLKSETEEVYIPANIVHMDDGLFDCLGNVDFIQVANGNPAYYSEFGILYHADGSLACMPQARICK